MKGKDTTVEELIAALQKCQPGAIVRARVTHDLDVDLCKQGPIFDLRKPKKGLVILEISDDCSHGFGKV